MSTSFLSPNYFPTFIPFNSNKSQSNLGFNPLFYASTFSTIMDSHYPPISKSPRDPQTKGPWWLFMPLLKQPPEIFFPAFFPSGLRRKILGWAVGLGVSLPLITAQLIALSKQVEMAAEAVEKVADVVENVAHDVDKAAEEFKEKLPEGKLKNMVASIEHLAEETAKDAQLVEDLMDKVEEMDEKLVELLTQKSTEPAKASPTTEEKAA